MCQGYRAPPEYDGRMPVGDVKAELRQFVRLTRSARSSAEREEASAGFGVAMMTLVAEEGWSRVAAFIPTSTEPPITDTLASLVTSGVETFVPVSTPEGILDWIRLEHGFVEDMATDSMGMPIPTSGLRGAIGRVDAVFVPAAARGITTDSSANSTRQPSSSRWSSTRTSSPRFRPSRTTSEST
jgi:hypothetical protein